jgi:hypothetical protein
MGFFLMFPLNFFKNKFLLVLPSAFILGLGMIPSGIPLPFISAQALQAQTDSGDMDSILSGFDEKETDSELKETDLLSGFDEEEPGLEQTETLPEEKGWLDDFSGKAGASLSYAYEQQAPISSQHPDWRGIRRQRGFLQLKWERRVFQDARVFIEGKIIGDLLPDTLDPGVYDALPQKNREAYDKYRQSLMESELREAYFQISPLSFMDLKLGRQIIVWGVADSLSVVDVLNPRDYRVPGLIDVEDARLPLNALKLDFYSGNWNLSAVAIPDIRFGKNPGYGSEYYFYSKLENFSDENNILPKEEIPESGTENAEYGMSLQGNFSGWDWMLYHADFYNDQARVVIEFNPPPLGKGLEAKSRVHDRLKLNGTGISLVSGSWLWKAEAAMTSGFRFYGTVKEYERQDLMLGIEYAGISDASLGFEISRRSYPDYDSILENPPNNADEHYVQSAFSYRHDFWNQTLHLNSFALMLGESWNKGATARVGLDYDWFDAFSVGGGWLVYQKGSDSEYASTTSLAYAEQMSRNDRIFLETAYSF